MMKRGSLVVVMTLALAFALTGCAGKVRVASSKSCAAHGGTYDASARSCAFERSTKNAAQICQANGGNYDSAADFCEYGME